MGLHTSELLARSTVARKLLKNASFCSHILARLLECSWFRFAIPILTQISTVAMVRGLSLCSSILSHWSIFYVSVQEGFRSLHKPSPLSSDGWELVDAVLKQNFEDVHLMTSFEPEIKMGAISQKWVWITLISASTQQRKIKFQRPYPHFRAKDRDGTYVNTEQCRHVS